MCQTGCHRFRKQMSIHIGAGALGEARGLFPITECYSLFSLCLEAIAYTHSGDVELDPVVCSLRMWGMSNYSNMVPRTANFSFVFLLVSPAGFIGSEQD